MFALAEFPLPYAHDALAPFISKETIETHYGKHVATYINNLNNLIENTPYESVPLLEIIQTSAQNPDDKKIFNNAAQIYNHNFFFNGMCAQCNTQIPEELIKAFGSAENLKKQFKDSAAALFGSGYTWLVQDKDEFKIINTKDAETPITNNMKPLLNLDVWEHAYYLDYKNKRADFIDAFLDNLVNWDFVAENIKRN